MLSENFKGRGSSGWKTARGAEVWCKAIGVRTDRDTHGSAACEVQHIVDLFLDYSPCFCLARESSMCAPLVERTTQLRATRPMQRAAEWIPRSSPCVAVRPSLTTIGKCCLVDGKEKNKARESGRTRRFCVDGTVANETLRAFTARNVSPCGIP